MFTPFIQPFTWPNPLTLRPLAIACLVTAAGLTTAACSPQPSPSATIVVAAPVAAASGDPSLPAASEVFGGKVREALEQPAGF